MRTMFPARCGLLFAAGLLASACGAGGTGSEGTGSDGTGAGKAAPSRAASSPPAETSAPPTLEAADGSDVTACRKADCEILVEGAVDVPLATRFGITDFDVRHEAPNTVTFEYARPDTEHVAEIKGTGMLALASGVKVTIEEIDDTGAVLRFEPKTLDPENDKASGSHGVHLHTEG